MNDCRELADPFEGHRQEGDDAHDGVDHDADVGQLGAEALAESRSHPLGPGQDVRPPDPGPEVDHAKDHVEQGPDPQQPDALDAVDEEHHDEPHRAGDIDAAGAVGDADHPPRQALARQEVGFRVLRGHLRHDPAHGHHHQQVRYDDRDVQWMHERLLVAESQLNRTYGTNGTNRTCWVIHAGQRSRCCTSSSRSQVATAQYLSPPP